MLQTHYYTVNTACTMHIIMNKRADLTSIKQARQQGLVNKLKQKLPMRRVNTCTPYHRMCHGWKYNSLTLLFLQKNVMWKQDLNAGHTGLK